jgi:hypothetical protein
MKELLLKVIKLVRPAMQNPEIRESQWILKPKESKFINKSHIPILIRFTNTDHGRLSSEHYILSAL